MTNLVAPLFHVSWNGGYHIIRLKKNLKNKHKNKNKDSQCHFERWKN